jgi:hypothetical protein
MERDHNEDLLDLIDLGVASIETQGLGQGKIDFATEQYTVMISDD